MYTFLIYLIIGIIAGAVIGALWGKAKIAAVRNELAVAKAEVVNELAVAKAEAVNELAVAKAEAETAHTRAIAEAEGNIQILNKEIEMLKKNLTDEKQAHERELQQRDALMKVAEQQAAERATQFREQLDMAREQLKTAAADLLAARTADLNNTNKRELETVLQPLREHINEMKKAIDTSRDNNTQNTATLKQAITDMMERTAGIGNEADKLARALRHENKTQGNWGEVILSELLDSQGLKRGINYEVQSTIVDKNGKPVLNENTDKRMIPDVILHYSDNKDLIIDSKVSLSAYLDYVGAETEEMRDDALRRHVKSLRAHVKELVAKDYKRYILHPRQSLDYVIMFVPNETALQLAMSAEPTLWRDAMKEGVFISGECNLTAALRIIHLAWRQEVQAQSQRKVFEEANLLVARVGDFYKTFTEFGTRIDKLKDAYTDSANKLINGRQSLMVPARRLREMGAKEKPGAPIPDANPDVATLLSNDTDATPSLLADESDISAETN
jgi:DNA recombination protein RmuC